MTQTADSPVPPLNDVSEAPPQWNLVDLFFQDQRPPLKCENQAEWPKEKDAEAEKRFARVEVKDPTQSLTREERAQLSKWLNENYEEIGTAELKESREKLVRELEEIQERRKKEASSQSRMGDLFDEITVSINSRALRSIEHTLASKSYSVDESALSKMILDNKFPEGRPLTAHDEGMIRLANQYIYNRMYSWKRGGSAISRQDVDDISHGATYSKKGNQYVTQFPNGDKIVTTISDNSSVTQYPNGKRIDRREDGVRISHPDGTVEYSIDPPDEAISTFDMNRVILRPDGTGQMTMEDGSIKRDLKRMPDGRWMMTDENENTIYLKFDKNAMTIQSDEVQTKADWKGYFYKDEGGIKVAANGRQSKLTFEDGVRVYRVSGSSTTIEPDGTQISTIASGDFQWTKRPDGTQQVAFSEPEKGRVGGTEEALDLNQQLGRRLTAADFIQSIDVDRQGNFSVVDRHGDRHRMKVMAEGGGIVALSKVCHVVRTVNGDLIVTYRAQEGLPWQSLSLNKDAIREWTSWGQKLKYELPRFRGRL